MPIYIQAGRAFIDPDGGRRMSVSVSVPIRFAERMRRQFAAEGVEATPAAVVTAVRSEPVATATSFAPRTAARSHPMRATR